MKSTKQVIDGTTNYLESISTDDDFRDYWNRDVINQCCREYVNNRQTPSWIDFEDEYALWFPKIDANGYGTEPKENQNIQNTVSPDGKFVIEKNRERTGEKPEEEKFTTKKTFIFGKYPDGIHFLGLFVCTKQELTDEYLVVTRERLTKEINLNAIFNRMK